MRLPVKERWQITQAEYNHTTTLGGMCICGHTEGGHCGIVGKWPCRRTCRIVECNCTSYRIALPPTFYGHLAETFGIPHETCLRCERTWYLADGQDLPDGWFSNIPGWDGAICAECEYPARQERS